MDKDTERLVRDYVDACDEVLKANRQCALRPSMGSIEKLNRAVQRRADRMSLLTDWFEDQARAALKENK